MSEHDSSSEGGSTSSPPTTKAPRRVSLTESNSEPKASSSPQTNTSPPHPDGLPPALNGLPWRPSPPPGQPPPVVALPTDTTSQIPADSSSAIIMPSQTPHLRSVSSPTGQQASLSASGPSPSSTPQLRFARTPELSREQSLHMRLASLPPPMMARYATQGSARLTPSIVPRPPPMPILNLPTLPPPTPVLNPPAPPRAPLRSIPALPLTGPRDDENPDMEEGSDSSDDGMDEEDAVGGRDDVTEEDDAEESMIPAGATMSRRRDRPDLLPQVDTSRLNISFSFGSTPSATGADSVARASKQQHGSQRPGTQYWTPSADVAATPHPDKHDGPTDYFSSKIRQPDSLIEEVSRTPRPSDYSPAVPLVAGPSRSKALVTTPNGSSGPGMVPRIVPMPLSPGSPALSSKTPRLGTTVSTIGERRPTLYQHVSKSMVDLVPHSKTKEEAKEEEDAKRSSRSARPATAGDPSPNGPLEIPERAPTLRRQRSLPTYRPASLPPPYPTYFSSRYPIIQPREEEGREVLPTYSNAIYLCSMMPRKVEFTAPGVQAKERKWRRVIVELEGTVLRIYRCHGAGSTGKGGIVGEWWERTVGVGDWSAGPQASSISATGGVQVNGSPAAQRDNRRIAVVHTANGNTEERRGKGVEDDPPAVEPPTQPQPTRSKLHQVASSFLHPTRSSQDATSTQSRLAVPPTSTRSRLSFDTSRDSERTTSVLGIGRRSMDALQRSGSLVRPTNSNATSDSSSNTTSPRSRSVTSPSSPSTPASSSISSPRSRPRGPSTSHSSINTTGTSDSNSKGTISPDPKDLIKSYTLQSAESGLASDYSKRRNVIRVRMEGEQFLLQARDVAGVIEWIEGIQAATNIALDLDERPMPKGPMFPRRRRRRPRTARPDASPATQTTGTGAASGSS
ncbi:hypothetical protein BXZ70DRAFT_541206 [Cristinia sonorae]|uniref:PH domain-containing protein n=1 Tax=Cristinia sonorae TaxID=1940300 RepID=A0A8K0UH46_9AGAR|nr:hypothetical protein BXZ70DRAFT_541206 [Cristinia sonorae]